MAISVPSQAKLLARRIPVNCQRALGGKKLRYVLRMCDRELAGAL